MAGKAVKMRMEEECDEHSLQTFPSESSMTGYRQQMEPREHTGIRSCVEW